MLEIPSYIKLIVDNGPKGVDRARPVGSKARTHGARSNPTASPQAGNQTCDVVYLVSKQNQRALESHLPTPDEAQEALERLQRDLPGMGQEVGGVHSNLNRSRLIQLLAPLVES